jgi:hypothetical protein
MSEEIPKGQHLGGVLVFDRDPFGTRAVIIGGQRFEVERCEKSAIVAGRYHSHITLFKGGEHTYTVATPKPGAALAEVSGAGDRAPKMSKAELVAKLRALAAEDPEEGHVDADQALLDYIGDPDVREAFAAVPKWYA